MDSKQENWYGAPEPAKRTGYEAFGNDGGRNENRQPQSAQKYAPPPRYDKMHPNPSKVVHLRSVDESLTEAMIQDAASHFGKVRALMILLGKFQALIEFENIDDATRLVQSGALRIGNFSCPANYSTSPEIRTSSARPAADSNKPHNVLLMTIRNVRYPITCEVIYQICSRPIEVCNGRVLRIVMVRKHGDQAMVEFDRSESAAKAKEFLNGAEIYEGCCNLSIEYAKATSLKVVRNDSETIDYTIAAPPRPPPLLDKPDPRDRYGYRDEYQPRGAEDRSYGHPPSYDRHYERPPEREYERGGPPSYGSRPGGSYDDRSDPYNSRDPHGRDNRDDRDRRDRYDDRGRSAEAESGGHGVQGAVIMIYGLAEGMNCDRTFNLFCLYGNVVRIKFLKSKEGSAMVQMGDITSMRRAIDNLNGLQVLGSKLSVSASRQAFLNEVPNPYLLKDGTPSYKDYMGSRNNRFSNPEYASKNRITPPSRCLHFFNAPAGYNDDEIEQIYKDAGLPVPRVTIMQGKSDRSTSGFIEWEEQNAAVDALVLTNHIELPNKRGGHPYVYKVCFTAPSRPHGGPHGGHHGGRAFSRD